MDASRLLQRILSRSTGTSKDNSSKLFIYVFPLKLFLHNPFLNLLQRKAQQASDRDFKYQQIMRNLVRRYVTVEQRKAESQGVTEDDVNEIKQDISAFRCELVEILKNSGMDTNVTAGQGGGKLKESMEDC